MPDSKIHDTELVAPYGANNNFLSQVQAAMQIPFLPRGSNSHD